MATTIKPERMEADDALREACEALHDEEAGDVCGDWSLVADQSQGSGRWQENRMLVLLHEPTGTYWGVRYAVGLTEYQDHDLPWKEHYSFDAVRLYPHQVITTEYRMRPPQ